MFIIQVRANTKTGWKKLRGTGPFIMRESAEAYGLKYWTDSSGARRFRVIEVSA